MSCGPRGEGEGKRLMCVFHKRGREVLKRRVQCGIRFALLHPSSPALEPGLFASVQRGIFCILFTSDLSLVSKL